MGCNPLGRNCSTNMNAIAPNPSPKHYTVLEKRHFLNATLLKVKYNGCTNFEGVKIMVYEGYFIPSGDLDPHFDRGTGHPIARFKPDALGMKMAIKFCELL